MIFIDKNTKIYNQQNKTTKNYIINKTHMI